MASAARAELLNALEARGIGRIQAAMAGYADAVQGVQLQAAAFELLARVTLIKEVELDTLIAEMRVLATRRRATAVAATAEAEAEAEVADEATASSEPGDAAQDFLTPDEGAERTQPKEADTEPGDAAEHSSEQPRALGPPPSPAPPPAAVPSPSGSPAAAPARAPATSPSAAAVAATSATSAAPVTPAPAALPMPAAKLTTAADPTPAADPTSTAEPTATAESTAARAAAKAPAAALPLPPPPDLALASRKPPATTSLSCLSPGSKWFLSQENQGAQKRAQQAC